MERPQTFVQFFALLWDEWGEQVAAVATDFGEVIESAKAAYHTFNAQLSETESCDNMKDYAEYCVRVDNFTGVFIQVGYFFENQDIYTESEERAEKYSRELGYESLTDAVEQGAALYTEWHE